MGTWPIQHMANTGQISQSASNADTIHFPDLAFGRGCSDPGDDRCSGNVEALQRETRAQVTCSEPEPRLAGGATGTELDWDLIVAPESPVAECSPRSAAAMSTPMA